VENGRVTYASSPDGRPAPLRPTAFGARVALVPMVVGDDGRMLMRLRKWIEGSRQRKRERWADEYGTLSAQDRHVVDSHKEAHGTWEEETGPYSTKIFDEQSRGRPGN